MERCEQELWLRTTIAETLERQALQGCSTDHTIGLPEPTPVDVSALGLAGLGGETFGGDGQAATIPPSDTATRESLRDITDDVDLGPELTQGGMGLLRVAYQRALQREVVVKTLLPRRCTPQTQAALLREARLAGRLEHPNTIPIYTVGWRRGEGPALVMKRIEGTPWSEYLDADARAGMLLHPAVLERHLNRLITVCHAVDFAHSRGVIHRDIKPENVMLGSFGEVYLLDWGVAVDMESLADEPEDLIVGTPVFMAPEQVRSDERPSLRTDVYLLGATLHQILTGQHRHAGDELVTVLVAAHLSKPHTYGPEVPDVLAKIANRACHREPEARFETVGAMRQALLTYLNNRPSVVAAQMALQELEQLEEAIDRVQQEDKGQGLEEINRRFSACRTGFEQALQGWPDNEAAQSGLQRCLEVMIRYEVWMGNAGSASLLFTDLRSPNLELKADHHLQTTLQATLSSFVV
ncbi:MAG: serine/threonine-protein kinase, partial [Myxococcota bacterium]